MMNYNYPLGADTPDAPWNEPEIPEKEFDVCISQTLSKSTSVTTNDYEPLIDECEDGNFPYVGTSDTNWSKAYSEEHLTPLELIAKFKEMLEETLEVVGGKTLVSSTNTKSLKWLIDECSDWVEDDTEIIEE